MRVIVSAGGTGGHIYPALAIINKIKQEDKNAEILYIGTTNRMEKDIIPNHNINYIGIKVKGLNRKNIFANIIVLYYFIKAIFKSKKIIKDFNPDIVIGVGGYVTAPVIYAAHKLGIKTLIHEQNSEFGMTNKFLAKYVDAIASSFQNMEENIEKTTYTGNPVGDASLNIQFDKKELKLTENKKFVLIVMGSLGSDVTSNKMIDILPAFNNKEYEVVYITGKDYYEKFKNLKLSKNIHIVPYVEDMRKTFSKVDVLVSRAGAATMSEIIAYKVPTILIPSPFVTHNHQYKNAKSFVEKNAALLLEEKDLDKELLVSKVEYLLDNEKKAKEMKENLSKMYIPNSANKIYNLIKKLVSEKQL
ncbi:MAG TPA: undecaprenyldiphospho-muramoylpentapeptide beta-N-acetylglucosaminyltransferase [Bacilli bacterium]|nr:undecaprenyldiphospho-muramoylpentapeptide beta-N-acetylglucosaminyltransferase [Bacilli bacterium]